MRCNWSHCKIIIPYEHYFRFIFNPHILAKNSVTQNFLFISFLSIAQLIIPLTSFPKAKLWANLSEEITNFEAFLLEY